MGPGEAVLDHGNGGGARQNAPPDAGSLAARMAELPDLPVPALKRAWAGAWGAPPPKGARRRFLMLGIAWRWQARIHGGFSRPLETRLAALESAFREGRRIESNGHVAAPRLLPGTRLVRVWRGARHEVHVVEGGYLWRGQTRASLSAIAREITGFRRNGPAFFGLRNGGRPG